MKKLFSAFVLMNKISSLLLLAATITFTFTSCCDNEDLELTGGVLTAERLFRNVGNGEGSISDASLVPALFAQHNIEYHSIGCLNWAEAYPYKPKAEFAIAHTGSQILLDYLITETPVVGTITDDLGSVWKENCAEFFVKLPSDSLYYNVECNCIGTILMESGQSRYNRTTSTLENVSQISRWSSFGSDSIGTIETETTWELSLIIPVSAFWRSDYGSLNGKTLNANIYHCIGSGDKRCYLTWAPITTEKPNFHQPESFQPIYFDK